MEANRSFKLIPVIAMLGAGLVAACGGESPAPGPDPSAQADPIKVDPQPSEPGRTRICVHNAICIEGSHFDPLTCICAPDPLPPPPTASGCVPKVACPAGWQWDAALCRCVGALPGGFGCTPTECDDGHQWDDASCACVPKPDAGCDDGHH